MLYLMNNVASRNRFVKSFKKIPIIELDLTYL